MMTMIYFLIPDTGVFCLSSINYYNASCCINLCVEIYVPPTRRMFLMTQAFSGLTEQALSAQKNVSRHTL